jgi:hypothetical protein
MSESVDPLVLLRVLSVDRWRGPEMKKEEIPSEISNAIWEDIQAPCLGYWSIVAVVNSNGEPRDIGSEAIHGKIIFVLAATRPGRMEGDLQNRVVVPFRYNDGSWTLFQTVYPDYSAACRICGLNGKCHCLACTAARIIQATRRTLEEILDLKYRSSVPNAVDRIMYYYQ